ncbi:transmembrane protein 208 isoform X2 [Lycorma delicatula]|uniref:transmembrane protein 208 isoform X2 n=1 Tax=Lycorma delicatula TaxID=130591 RepID=UPI003F50DF27
MPPKKGKEGTKGQKQIVEENTATVTFYRNMILGAVGIFVLVKFILGDFFTIQNILLFILASICYAASYHFMVFMSKAKLTETGQIIDSGVDLNMEGGIAEHVKDLIILTSAVQVLSLLSNYFWVLWLLAPARGFWLLWVNILSPYFFQQAPAPEVDEKKQRKLERKMRRH